MAAAPVDQPTSSSTARRGLTPPTRRGFSSRLIGDVAVDLGFTDRETVERAVKLAKGTRRTTGRVLIDEGAITPDQLARVIAERYGLDHVDLMAYELNARALELIPPPLARRHRALPIDFIDDRTVLVAMVEPGNVPAMDDIAMLTGFQVRPAIAAPEDLDLILARLGVGEVDEIAASSREEADTEAQPEAEELRDDAEDAPVVRLVHNIIHQAIERGASDVHLVPAGSELRGEFRIDGVLMPGLTIPRKLAGGVVSRVKVMASLDIAERRIPQDGRMGLSIDGRPVDVRVVTMPLVSGEGVVMRILDRRSGPPQLDELGMRDGERDRFIKAVQGTQGAILVTGPTGAGKTTTLYAALNDLAGGQRNVVTVEDPVEYRMDGLRQMQVNTKTGLTFAFGLRAILRADPDVVMVGEVRDHETAHIAVEAALTGHLVLTTLHTNDAASSVARLCDMGVEPYLVASAVKVVVNQRLARRICGDCRKPVEHAPEELVAAGYPAVDPMKAYEAGGCRRCAGTGYRGRLGLYEVLAVDDTIRPLIVRRAPAHELHEAAVRNGMRPIAADGLLKVRAGITSLAEVLRVVASA
jgi:type IV pilus assembly protein PilB